jgi:K+-sensing histidine kinase KdpD
MPDGHVRIYVKDTGIGIPSAVQKHVFSAFARGNNYAHDISGAGLGLSIWKSLTGKMDGEIGFKLIVNVGSHFRVQFKAA